MEKIMVFDEKEKSKLGMICALPPLAFIGCLAYYLFVLRELVNGPVEPGSIMTYTLRNYDTMLVLLAISGILAAAVLIYCIVILARLKNMNSATKLIWLLILSTFAGVSPIIFWYFVINREPKYVPIYPDIA